MSTLSEFGTTNRNLDYTLLDSAASVHVFHAREICEDCKGEIERTLDLGSHNIRILARLYLYMIVATSPP